MCTYWFCRSPAFLFLSSFPWAVARSLAGGAFAPAAGPLPMSRNKLRRPTVVLSWASIGAFSLRMPLSRERECFCFQLDEEPSDRADRTIKIRRLRRFQVGKEPRHPRPEMPVEEIALTLYRCSELPGNQTRHDLAEDRCVVFGLVLAFDALDTEINEVGAQSGQRPLVQKTGQVIGSVGQQLAATDADEEVEIFAGDRGGLFLRSCSSERLMRNAERRPVAPEPRQSLQQRQIRRAHHERRKQRVFLRARNGGVVECVG